MQFTTVAFDGIVGSGVSNPLRVTMSGVAKTNEKFDFCIPNEFIASQIGRTLGLPLPPGCICKIAQKSNVKAFVCLEFGDRQQSLPPIDPEEVVERMPDLCTGVLLFDILIANPDRHVFNLRSFLHKKPYELIVFDHSHALFGCDEYRTSERLSGTKDLLGITSESDSGTNRHCLLDAVKDHRIINDWIGKITALPDYIFTDAARYMRDQNLITDVEFVQISDFLRYRRDNISAIVERHRIEFKGIAQFDLGIRL